VKRALLLSFCIFLILSFFPRIGAGSGAYRMTLTIWTGSDEFTYLTELSERDFSKIENDPSSAIQPHLVAARREYAEKMGYRKEIYGEENYKMVTIGRYTIVVRDISRDRIVFKKN
jgi:hypothetical protein